MLDWTGLCIPNGRKEGKKKAGIHTYIHTCTHTHTRTYVYARDAFIHWPPIPTLTKCCRDPPLFSLRIVLYCIVLYIHMDVPSSAIASPS